MKIVTNLCLLDHGRDLNLDSPVECDFPLIQHLLRSALLSEHHVTKLDWLPRVVVPHSALQQNGQDLHQGWHYGSGSGNRILQGVFFTGHP